MINNEKIKIIVHISSKYIDISDIFFSLLKKYYQNCPYTIIINYADSFVFKEYNIRNSIINIGNGNSLTNDVVAISNKYKCDYYVSILADMFISDYINQERIDELFEECYKRNISYCRLIGSNQQNDIISNINKNDIWAVSFCGFIASREYINKYFTLFKNDLEFEEYYVKISNNTYCKEEFYDDLYINNTNLFNVKHGIKNGVWIRKTKNYLKKIGVTIDKKRKTMSICSLMLWKLKQYLRKYIKNENRIKIKKYLSYVGIDFKSKY